MNPARFERLRRSPTLYPGVAEAPVQDSFTLLGFSADPAELELTLGERLAAVVAPCFGFPDGLGRILGAHQRGIARPMAWNDDRTKNVFDSAVCKKRQTAAEVRGF